MAPDDDHPQRRPHDKAQRAARTAGGYIYLYGSPTLVRSMMAADLVDELLLTSEPIVLGGGKTIWSDNLQALEWELVSTAKAKTGSQVCRYARVR
ncbi:MAG: dihydrofolate reductase family protein [Acidimicrobiia bacterium]